MTDGSLNQGEIDELLGRLNSTKNDSTGTLPEKEEKKSSSGVVVERLQFAPLKESPPKKKRYLTAPYEEVPLKLSLELGGTSVTVQQLLKLEKDTVLKLDKMAGETVNLLANGRPLACGEVIVINDHFGIRITSISDQENDQVIKDKRSLDNE